MQNSNKFPSPGSESKCTRDVAECSQFISTVQLDTKLKQHEKWLRIEHAASKIGNAASSKQANLSDLEFDNEHARHNQAMPAHESSHVDQITANRTSNR